MELSKIYKEEDLFPKEITNWEKRSYGYLFYNEENKDSYDSNHALIYKDRVEDIKQVLDDITSFYINKGITPNIYQSMSDDGYFVEMQKELLDSGYDSWTEEQHFMVLCEENRILPNADIIVKRVFEWLEEYGTEIFEKADEPWEIEVAKKAIQNKNTLFWVAFWDGKPVGMTYSHIKDEVCRADYILVSKAFRHMGVATTLMYHFVDYCRENRIDNCFLWPASESAEKIYEKAGFRHVDMKQAGRAVYHKKYHKNL